MLEKINEKSGKEIKLITFQEILLKLTDSSLDKMTEGTILQDANPKILSILFSSARLGIPEIILKFSNKIAGLNYLRLNNESLVMTATKNGHARVIEVLNKAGLTTDQLNERDDKSQTLIMIAAMLGNKEVVDSLIKAGLTAEQLNEKDSEGQTPAMIAAQNGHNLLAEVLEAASLRMAHLNEHHQGHIGSTELSLTASPEPQTSLPITFFQLDKQHNQDLAPETEGILHRPPKLG